MLNTNELINKYDAVALLSGGLDSILAMRIIMDQGLKVLGLHFCSPFFGHPEAMAKWKEIYGIEAVPVDISQDILQLITNHPRNGFGSALNPCTDCHTLMATKAREIMEQINAKFIVSGEVMWQRPMSQRPDAMNIVHRDSHSKGFLLRPLSALKLEPTEVEKSGLVDRSKLLGIYGRGRIEQLQLAKKYGFTEIPAPGGGCILTERKSSARFWVIFNEFKAPAGNDFLLAQAGRFFHDDGYILALSKTIQDAELLKSCQKDSDILLELLDFAGPLTLGRSEKDWSAELIAEAASLTASYANKAIRSLPEGTTVRVKLIHKQQEEIINVLPRRETRFRESSWEETERWTKMVNEEVKEQRLADKKEKFWTWISRKDYQKLKKGAPT